MGVSMEALSGQHRLHLSFEEAVSEFPAMISAHYSVTAERVPFDLADRQDGFS